VNRKTRAVVILITSALAMVVGASFASAEERTVSASRQAVAVASPFCQDAAIFGKHGAALQTLPPSTLKADYTRFKLLDAQMVPLAPSSIRTDLAKVLNFDLGLFKGLSKVGWSFAKLPHSVLAQWAIAGPRLKPDSDKVIAYLDKSCGLKLPLP
jgi:hypothetical protein